jgi:hypothetical protein
LEGCDVLNLDDPRFRLNDLLARYEARTAPRELPSQPDQAQEEAIVEAFDQLTRDIIRPTMEDIGAKLERKGIEHEILIAPGQQVTMRFYPPAVRRFACAAPVCPYVSFSRDASTAKIHVVKSTLMPTGQGRAEIAATLPLDQVTRHCVETQICDVLEDVLGGPKK